jgi:hypothetical protein
MAQGEVASAMASQGRLDVGMMRPFIGSDGRCYVTVYRGGDRTNPASYSTQPIQVNATLRRDEWKQLDEAILKIAEYRLGGVQDLIDAGLTYQLGNALGTTVLEWHDVGDAAEAVVTMDGITRAKGDRPKFQFNYLPIPIIHVDYEINARALAASRSLGNPLDTTMAERAARRINETLEGMLFTDTTYAFGEADSRSRNSIYSYINHPDINEVTLTANWDASGKTGAQIVDDVLAMKQSSIDAYFYGPWKLYIPTAYETVLDKDYDATTPGTTIRERILKISGITGIKVVDRLPANNVLLVQMTSDVVRLVQGFGLQNVEWGVEGNLLTKYKVMTIQVPQIRSDQNGHTGIVLAAPAS